MRPKLKLKTQEVNHDETTIRNWLLSWLMTMPRFRQWGMAFVYYNGGLPIGNTGRWRRHGGKWWKAGVADIFIAYRGRLRFAETKRSKGGKVSLEQIAFQNEARSKGFPSEVVNAVDDPMRAAIIAWMDEIDRQEDESHGQ